MEFSLSMLDKTNLFLESFVVSSAIYLYRERVKEIHIFLFFTPKTFILFNFQARIKKKKIRERNSMPTFYNLVLY